MKAGAAERSAKHEDQLLQQPANAAELHGAMPTQPPAGHTITVSFLAALIHVACDSPQVCSSICLLTAQTMQLSLSSRDTNLKEEYCYSSLGIVASAVKIYAPSELYHSSCTLKG